MSTTVLDLIDVSIEDYTIQIRHADFRSTVDSILKDWRDQFQRAFPGTCALGKAGPVADMLAQGGQDKARMIMQPVVTPNPVKTVKSLASMKLPEWLELPSTVARLSGRIRGIIQNMALSGWTVEDLKRPSIRYYPQTVSDLAKIPLNHLRKYPGVGAMTALQIHNTARIFLAPVDKDTPGNNYVSVDNPFRNVDFAPQHLRTAARMLNLLSTSDLPPALVTRLNAVAEYTQTAGGTLMSRQVIAAIIDQWEHYPTLYTPDRRPTDPQGNRVMFNPANPPASQIEPDFTDEGDK